MGLVRAAQRGGSIVGAVWMLGGLSLTPSAVLAATYRVGPGRPYTSLQQVSGLLNPGDLVEVDGDATYPGGVSFRRAGAPNNPIVIRGITVNGRRPIISGGGNTVEFVSYDDGGNHYVFESFEITAGTNRCVYHQSDDLTLRFLEVHDCPKQGILGADGGSGSITIEHTEVHHCGQGTQNHQIYMSADQGLYPDSVFRLQYSWIHDANGGNNVKSRAARNEIYYNRIEGAYYHELELIGSEEYAEPVAREDGDVVGNLLVKKGPNADFAVTRIGGDGTGQSWARYRFVNNTIVVAGGAAVFRIFDGIESVEAHNNVFFRPGSGAVNLERTTEADWLNGRTVAGRNNWVESGSSNTPPEWTGTLTGADPGFTDAAGGDYTPVVGSPLLEHGMPSPAPPPGFPGFPNPLVTPLFVPPGPPYPFGVATPRPAVGTIDIGAYELGSAPPALSITNASLVEGDGGVATTP